MCFAFEVAFDRPFFTNKYDNAFATQLTCYCSSCLIMHSMSTLRCACIGLVYIYVLSHVWSAKGLCMSQQMQRNGHSMLLLLRLQLCLEFSNPRLCCIQL